MTSVLAVRQKAWMVFFIGTADGHLIKLAVDKNYHTACPRVLYRAIGDRQVLPKIHLDQVDVKHVYVPFQNQMKRVPVSKCSTYTTVQDCWSARDPYCVWCSSKSSCTFEDDCKDSDWVSIPDDSQQKMVSYKVVKNSAGQITLNIQTHLTVGQKAQSTFNCEFSPSLGQLCSRQSPPPQFPQCTCILSDSTLPPEGLVVTVTIRIGMTQLLEQLKLSNCMDIRGPTTFALCRQCIEAGCGWSTNGCSWATAGVMKRPVISSITPSIVSFYGKNHALLSGNNLKNVTRVRIQADMDCTQQE
ncbi:plexin-C1-like [Symphorus nematophorus]